jgi:polyhydroxybutyrate depolymerase
MSNGGFFTHRLGCERSTRFAAIAAVAGGMSPVLEKACAPSAPLAVLNIHGKADPIVPYAGGTTMGGGSALAAEQTANVWQHLNSAITPPVQTFVLRDVLCRTYADGRAPVTLCDIEHGGHTWPGGNEYAPETMVGPTNRDINASETIWEFFAANPRTAKKAGRPKPPANLRIVR